MDCGIQLLTSTSTSFKEKERHSPPQKSETIEQQIPVRITLSKDAYNYFFMKHFHESESNISKKKYSVILVRKRTIPTKQPPLVGEV
jgi:hypothetical protein